MRKLLSPLALAAATAAGQPVAAGQLHPFPVVNARSFNPALAVLPDEQVLLLWQGFLRPGVARLYQGQASDAAPTLSADPPGSLGGFRPRLYPQRDGSRVHLLYRDRAGATDIFWATCSQGSWRPARNLSRTGGDSDHAVLAGNGRTLTVIWEDDTGGAVELWVTRSTDGGRSWSEPAPTGLPRRHGSFLGHHALEATGDGSVHLLWEDGETSLTEVYHSVLRNGRWSEPRSISESPDEFSGEPALARVGGGLQAVWVEQDRVDPTAFDLARATLGENGLWRRLGVPTSSGGSVSSPQLLAGADLSLTLVWERSNGVRREVVVSRGPFATAQAVSGGLRDPRRSQAALGPGGVLHLAFDAPGEAGERLIYYQRVDHQP